MAYSYVQYEGNGSTKTFSVPFPYLSTSHVEVRIDNVLKTEGADYTWPTSSSIQFSATPSANTIVDIRRHSGVGARIVDFQDGSTLTQEILDLDSNQLFYLSQEAWDSGDGRLPADLDAQWTAEGKRLKDLGAPIAGADAVNKDYVDNGVNSSVVIAQQYAAQAAASAFQAEASVSHFTVSTADPSGGVDGDIWFKVTL